MLSVLPRLARAALIAAVLLLGRAAAQGEKGGLVPADLPTARVSAALGPRRLALLVGVQQFDDPRWRALRFPQSDAAAFAAVLRDPSRGDFDQVEVLAPGATRDELRTALARLASRDADEEDTVVVYVSSHGTLSRDARGELRRYLVAQDTRMDAISETALPVDELRAAFDRLRSRKKVLILAACHSGAGKSLLPPELEAEAAGIKSGFFVRPIEESSRASIVLAASAWGETAREDARLGSDIYTHFLLEALREGMDRNGDGAVTATEAHDFARTMTYQFTGGRQRPTAESVVVGADPVVLVGRKGRAGRPELYSYSPRLDGFTVRIDGRPLAELPGGVALDAGVHRVQVAKGGAEPLLDARLDLAPGDRLEVEGIVARSVGRVEVAPRIGGVAFLDRRSREDVLGGVTTAGVTVAARGWPSEVTELRVDLAASSGTTHLSVAGTTARVDFALVAAGLALPWRFHPAVLHGAELYAGPRLSTLWVSRRFELAPSPAVAQSYYTFTPGAVAGVDVPLTRRISLGAEGHLDWALVRIDGGSRWSGLASWQAGLGWRF